MTRQSTKDFFKEYFSKEEPKKKLFKPNIEEDLNRLHNVSLTEGEMSTILYIMEGYLQGSDDYKSAAYQTEDDTFSKDCDQIFFKLERVVDTYYNNEGD